MDKFQHNVDYARQQLNRNEGLKKIGDAIGVEPSYIAGAAAAIVLLFVFFGIGGGLICNLIGFLYPAYASFKAIETVQQDDDKQWLTYWVVYAAFNLVEFFSDTLLFWVPLYYPLKLTFLVWCFLPSTKGACVVYGNFIRPFLKKHETKIDQAISEVHASAGQAAVELGKTGAHLIQRHSVELLSKVAELSSSLTTQKQVTAEEKKD
eukprot:GILK01000888.1.p1 GENE.GILK01000888.1~~GILK01000888.1.p1  ORF type:complete len:207 (-),score=45.42 GILK01000888.1:242-862(-)